MITKIDVYITAAALLTGFTLGDFAIQYFTRRDWRQAFARLYDRAIVIITLSALIYF